ncbi:SCP2 domain-containing protein [Gammaproteobacteria bacterium]|nr:SCP2 domain-containing protein [Gammaproteobacteria bacterium]
MLNPANFLSHLTHCTPYFLKLPLKCTPQPLQKIIIEHILNTLFIESLQDDELDFLEDKYLSINVIDIDYQITLTLSKHKLIMQNKPHKQAQADKADVTLSANFNDLILMISRREDPDTLFFQRKLNIEGDTALGLGVKNWLDGIEMDLLPKWCQHGLQKYAAAL